MTKEKPFKCLIYGGKSFRLPPVEPVIVLTSSGTVEVTSLPELWEVAQKEYKKAMEVSKE